MKESKEGIGTSGAKDSLGIEIPSILEGEGERKSSSRESVPINLLNKYAALVDAPMDDALTEDEVESVQKQDTQRVVVNKNVEHVDTNGEDGMGQAETDQEGLAEAGYTMSEIDRVLQLEENSEAKTESKETCPAPLGIVPFVGESSPNSLKSVDDSSKTAQIYADSEKTVEEGFGDKSGGFQTKGGDKIGAGSTGRDKSGVDHRKKMSPSRIEIQISERDRSGADRIVKASPGTINSNLDGEQGEV